MKHIAIAGAGPAGAATAHLLAQRGFKVSLIEQEKEFDRVFRGEGLMPSGLQALHDMGLADTFASIPHRPLDAWDFYIGGSRRMRVSEPVKNGIRTQIFDQGSLLKAIVNQAEANANLDFYPGCQVMELLRHKGEAIGVRIKGEGRSRDILADGVIAADGRYSKLRKLAGLELAKSSVGFDVLWFKLPAPPDLKEETPFIACLQPDCQFAFYPSWDGRLQIGYILEKSAKRSNPFTRQKARPSLAELKSRDWISLFASALPDRWSTHFRAYRDALEGPIYLDVQVGCCEQWSLPGLLLIGDAAHPMAPNRAQGINMALRDAIVVANHLAAGDRRSGQVPHHIFQAVQAERQPEIEAVQKLQLSEWKKVALLSQPGAIYQGFKSALSLFGRFQFAQSFWLHEQQGLRYGVLPVSLTV